MLILTACVARHVAHGMWQEGEEAARKARLRAEAAAQMAADARKLMHKVLDDTTTLLGLTGGDDR